MTWAIAAEPAGDGFWASIVVSPADRRIIVGYRQSEQDALRNADKRRSYWAGTAHERLLFIATEDEDPPSYTGWQEGLELERMREVEA